MTVEFRAEQTEAPTQSEIWDKFFKGLLTDYEKVDLIWNDATRRELLFTLSEEINAFDKERVILFIALESFEVLRGLCQELRPQMKIAWNAEEFAIPYKSIANELSVGKYYIHILLKNTQNATVR